MSDTSHKSAMTEDTQALLTKVRKTIRESEALLAQVELRREETDRLLASQGLTREQVEAMNFTPEQVAAVNAELKRRGMSTLDEEWLQPSQTGQYGGRAAEPNFEAEDTQGDLENRRRKFNTMMQDYRL